MDDLLHCFWQGSTTPWVKKETGHSNLARNFSLTIPLHLKCVATLPCEPLCSKIALISSLKNTSCGLFIVSLWTELSVFQTSEAIWLYMLQYWFWYILLAVIFSACCVYPNSLCIIRCLHSKSAIISEIVDTPINFQICGCRTALTSIQLTTKYNSATSPEYKSARRERFDAASADAWDGMKQSVIQDVIDHQRRCLHTCNQPHEDIMNIHCDKN